jgi:hypothetical protein
LNCSHVISSFLHYPHLKLKRRNPDGEGGQQ